MTEDRNVFFTYVQAPIVPDRYYLKYASLGSRHSVNDVFALPGRYAAQIRSYRRFGTAYRVKGQAFQGGLHLLRLSDP